MPRKISKQVKNLRRYLEGGCTKCVRSCKSECCTAIRMLPEEKEAMDSLLKKRGIPVPPQGMGPEKCEYLDSDGKCSVYEERPIICRAFGKVRSPLMTCATPGFQCQRIPESPELFSYMQRNREFTGNKVYDQHKDKKMEDWGTVELVQMAVQGIFMVQSKQAEEKAVAEGITEIEGILNKRGESIFKYLPPGAMQAVFGDNLKFPLDGK